MRAHRTLRSLTLAVALTATPSAVAAQAGQTVPESPMVAQMEYFVRDGGVWQMPNDSYVPGGDEPQHWRLEYEWAPEKQLLHARIVSRLDDGRRIVNWRISQMWDPVERRARYYQVAWDGTLGVGFMEVLDEDSRVADMRLMQPQGEEQMVRHRLELVGPDTYESTVQLKGDDGTWQTVSTGTWTRVRDAEASPGAAFAVAPSSS